MSDKTQIRTMRRVCEPMLACCKRNQHDPRFAAIRRALLALVGRWGKGGRCNGS